MQKTDHKRLIGRVKIFLGEHKYLFHTWFFYQRFILGTSVDLFHTVLYWSVCNHSCNLEIRVVQCGVFLFSFGYIFEHHFADCNKSVFCKIVYTIVVLYMVRHKMFWTRKRNNFSTLGANHIQFDFCARSCQRKSIGQFYVEQ